MKKSILSTLLVIGFAYVATAQNVSIPDANFKAYLVGNAAINTNSDTEIQVSEANAFTGMIDCQSLSISDLTGIEVFTSLTNLNCQFNQLSTLDVSNNTALTSLNCFMNQLIALDVSNNTALLSLFCNRNQLTALDVSNNTALGSLDFYNNSISVLDVSNNTALNFISASNNQLAVLDLSSNVSLTYLNCSFNQLVTLNVANGNNANMGSFYANSNPNLACIEVDVAAYSTANWTNIDVTASFSEDCSSMAINEANNAQFSFFPNPTTSTLTIQTKEVIEFITIYNLMGEVVQTETKNTFSVAELSPGIYLLQLQTANGISTSRFVKE